MKRIKNIAIKWKLRAHQDRKNRKQIQFHQEVILLILDCIDIIYSPIKDLINNTTGERFINTEFIEYLSSLPDSEKEKTLRGIYDIEISK